MAVANPGGGGGKSTSSPKTYQQALDIQMKLNPQKSSGGGFTGASRSEVEQYFNPGNYATGDARFQHLILSSGPGITASQMNAYLKGKGVLSGMGSAFVQGGSSAGVNPVYLAVHAVLETGSGTSPLARGTVGGYGGYHNVYGINANDGNAAQGGASYAKREGWNSVEKAIIGGAKFVGSQYISKGQDTLYKMRWNPANPGNHQYATDIGWAVKQSGSIAKVYKDYFSSSPVSLDVPIYDGQGSGTSGPDPLGPKIIAEAKKHLGKPYVFGANPSNPESFDCSSFTSYVYKKVAGMNFPRTAAEQVSLGTPVNIQDLKAGDLVFWAGTYKAGVSHVAIAMGDGKFIGAQGDKVSIEALNDPYWKKYYHSSRRVLSESDVGTGGGPSGGGGSAYVPVVNDDTPTGLAGGLPISIVNTYQDKIDDALENIKEKNINHGIIIDLKNGGSVEFHLPDDISDTNPVSYEDVAVLGRSMPIKGYENSGPRSISFELDFFAGTDISGAGEPVNKMRSDVAFLQSLAYPDYSKSFVLPPAVLLLSLGKIVQLKVVCTTADVVWKKPYTVGGRPMRATVSLEFQAVSDFPPDFYDIRSRNRNAIG